jgi:uncharacterized membrane protein YkvI
MIISAVVGAGFATGAELIAFFGATSLPPIVIAFFVGIFLFCVMAVMVCLPMKLSKKIFAPIFFIFFVAMTAGIAELVGPIAAAIAVMISILIVWFGFERMLGANKILMGFALVVLSVLVVANLGGTLPVSQAPVNAFGTIGSALLYAGMNCCLLPAIFVEAKRKCSRKDLLLSVIVATVVITFFVFVILTAIRVNNVAGAAMPILALSNSFIVRLAVFICILTSMFATLFNLQTQKKIPLLGIGALGYFISFLGFTKVIGIFYPIVGVVMIGVISFSLMLAFFRVLRVNFCR